MSFACVSMLDVPGVSHALLARKPMAAACARSSDLLSQEKVHGSFVALVAEVAIRYRFSSIRC